MILSPGNPTKVGYVVYFTYRIFIHRKQRPHNGSRQERRRLCRQAWEAQMPALFEAYLRYRCGDSEVLPDAELFEISVLGTEGLFSVH